MGDLPARALFPLTLRNNASADERCAKAPSWIRQPPEVGTCAAAAIRIGLAVAFADLLPGGGDFRASAMATATPFCRYSRGSRASSWASVRLAGSRPWA